MVLLLGRRCGWDCRGESNRISMQIEQGLRLVAAPASDKVVVPKRLGLPAIILDHKATKGNEGVSSLHFFGVMVPYTFCVP